MQEPIRPTPAEAVEQRTTKNECGCKCNPFVSGCTGKKDLVVMRPKGTNEKSSGRITICSGCYIVGVDEIISDPKGIGKRMNESRNPPRVPLSLPLPPID